MAEYIFTNLPQYVKVNSRSEFSSSVVSSGAILLFTEDGYTLTGKLPDGTFITIGGGGGGTDVSDTTATAATVLSGYDFYNSSGVKTSGSIPTVSATSSGNEIVVPSGYISASQVFPVSGGAEVILGYINSSGRFQPLAFSGTVPYDSGSAVLMSTYQWDATNGNTSGLIISSGEESRISSGQTWFDTTVVYGGMLFVDSGGKIDGLQVDSGYISINGSANNVSCANGRINFIQDCTVTGAIVEYPHFFDLSIGSNTFFSGTLNGSNLSVSGGYVSGFTVSSGMLLRVSPGADVADLTVLSGGGLILSEDAVISGFVISSGGRLGVDLTTQMNVSGTSNGSPLVISGGSASGLDMQSFLDVNSGCRADDITVLSGGQMTAESGGSIFDTAVDVGGRMFVRSGGEASAVIVSSGGSLRVENAGAAIDVTSQTGAAITVEPGGFIIYA